MAPSRYVGVTPSFNLKAASAYIKQISASFPTSSYFGVIIDSVSFAKLIEHAFIDVKAWAIFFIGMSLYTYATQRSLNQFKISKQAYYLSAAMVFFPALFPAISSRYQKEIDWGVGTLPVYYQWIGMSLLIIWALFYLNSKINKRNFSYFIAFLFGAYLSLNYTANSINIPVVNKPWHEPRMAFRAASLNGLFGSVKDGDIVEKNNCANYINSNLIFQYTNKRVYVPTDDHAWFPEQPNPGSDIFSLSCSSGEFRLTKNQ